MIVVEQEKSRVGRHKESTLRFQQSLYCRKLMLGAISETPAKVKMTWLYGMDTPPKGLPVIGFDDDNTLSAVYRKVWRTKTLAGNAGI